MNFNFYLCSCCFQRRRDNLLCKAPGNIFVGPKPFREGQGICGWYISKRIPSRAIVHKLVSLPLNAIIIINHHILNM